MHSALISTNGLTKRYQNVTVLENVTLTIPEGQIIGLVGPNGAGKSTFLRCLVGHVLPTSGTCITLGTECNRLGYKELSQLSYIDQQPGMIFWLKAESFVKLIRSYYPGSWNNERSESLWDRLTVRRNVRIAEMSAGEKQRLAILIAASITAKLSIFDEPMSALDPLSRRTVLDLFVELLQSENRSIVLCSHFLADVEKVADRVLALKNGSLIIDSELDELKESYFRMHIEAIGSDLELPEISNGIVRSERDGNRAVLLVTSDAKKQMEQALSGRALKVDAESLNLEDIYEVAFAINQ